MDYTIVIDYQKDFIDGVLYNASSISIRPNIIKRIKEDIKKGNKLIFTRDTHDDSTFMDSNEGKHLPIKHCIKNTEGWELDKEMMESFNYPHQIIDKPTFGYKDWNLEEPENIYMMGVCTDICVISNAIILKALYPNTNVYVYSDSCAGLTQEKHNAALETMKSCQVEVI
ncbi:MAG: cysteine hydrolase [Acholeplasmatales bacterium]|nr:cysteine hydrolase [Acholeplasmatales bacterium]